MSGGKGCCTSWPTEHDMTNGDRRSVSRRAMVASLLMLAWAGKSRAAACAPLHVLFVCPVGTVKSAIAREALRR